MHLFSSVILPLGLVYMRMCIAAPAHAKTLRRRDVDNLPPSDQFVVCPGYRYSRAQVEAAIQQGINTTPTNAPQPGTCANCIIPDDSLWSLSNFRARRLPPCLWQ